MNMMPPAVPAGSPDAADARSVIAAAHLLLPDLEAGRRIDAIRLRAAMESAFGASDAAGVWDWKTAYEATEAATVLFLRKYGRALLRKAGSTAAMLPLLTRITGLLPSQTRRSEEMQARQQFSSPVPLGLAAVTAAAIISWREAHQGFGAVEELVEVDGVGEATLARLAPLVTL